MPVIKAGTLNRRVALQIATETQDTVGQVQQTWSAVGTYWASIMPLSGRELVNAQQLRADVSHEVRMRFPVGTITTKHRLVYGSRVFHIGAVLNEGEGNVEYRILATEVQ